MTPQLRFGESEWCDPETMDEALQQYLDDLVRHCLRMGERELAQNDKFPRKRLRKEVLEAKLKPHIKTKILDENPDQANYLQDQDGYEWLFEDLVPGAPFDETVETDEEEYRHSGFYPKRLRIRNFKRLRDIEADFTSNPVTLTGKGSAGKTTTLMAILWALQGQGAFDEDDSVNLGDYRHPTEGLVNERTAYENQDETVEVLVELTLDRPDGQEVFVQRSETFHVSPAPNMSEQLSGVFATQGPDNKRTYKLNRVDEGGKLRVRRPAETGSEPLSGADAQAFLDESVLPSTLTDYVFFKSEDVLELDEDQARLNLQDVLLRSHQRLGQHLSTLRTQFYSESGDQDEQMGARAEQIEALEGERETVRNRLDEHEQRLKKLQDQKEQIEDEADLREKLDRAEQKERDAKKALRGFFANEAYLMFMDEPMQQAVREYADEQGGSAAPLIEHPAHSSGMESVLNDLLDDAKGVDAEALSDELASVVQSYEDFEEHWVMLADWAQPNGTFSAEADQTDARNTFMRHVNDLQEARNTQQEIRDKHGELDEEYQTRREQLQTDIADVKVEIKQDRRELAAIDEELNQKKKDLQRRYTQYVESHVNRCMGNCIGYMIDRIESDRRERESAITQSLQDKYERASEDLFPDGQRTIRLIQDDDQYRVQLEKHGSESDDGHTYGQMAKIATTYAVNQLLNDRYCHTALYIDNPFETVADPESMKPILEMLCALSDATEQQIILNITDKDKQLIDLKNQDDGFINDLIDDVFSPHFVYERHEEGYEWSEIKKETL